MLKKTPPNNFDICFSTLPKNANIEVFNTVGVIVLFENIITKIIGSISVVSAGMCFIKVNENGQCML